MPDWLSVLLHPDLATLSATGVYVVLFTLVFVESGLPGDTVLFAAGLLAAREGSSLSLPLLALGTAVCAVAGDAVGYWTGRRLGRPWVERRAGRAAQHLDFDRVLGADGKLTGYAGGLERKRFLLDLEGIPSTPAPAPQEQALVLF